MLCVLGAFGLSAGETDNKHSWNSSHVFRVVWLHNYTLQRILSQSYHCHTPFWLSVVKIPSLTKASWKGSLPLQFLVLSCFVLFFFTKFRLQHLRKALSCCAEFRKSYSADKLDFAKGSKCQQADSFFCKGAGRISHFNLRLGISASLSARCITWFQPRFRENPACFCSFPIISPTQIELLIWIFMIGEQGGLWSHQHLGAIYQVKYSVEAPCCETIICFLLVCIQQSFIAYFPSHCKHVL